jgi:pyrroloquinoline quinone (PQQ) biosynthesis protein C
MSTATFMDDVDSELRDRSLSILDCDFLVALEAGELSVEQIRRWALSYYGCTKNGHLAIANFLAYSPEDQVLRSELAENLYEEETGVLSGVGRCHMDVFLDFLGVLGVSPAEARLAQGLSASAYAHPIESDEFYAQLTAYGVLGEGPNAVFCERVLAAFRADYSFSEDELSWFSLHAKLDKNHGATLRRYAEAAESEPGGLERAQELIFGLAPHYQSIWDGRGTWRVGPSA